MAPAKPPLSSRQTPAAAAPNRHHRTRLAPQQASTPEESPNPASMGKERGSAPPPKESFTTTTSLGSNLPPTAAGVGPPASSALEGKGKQSVQLESSFWEVCPPLSADLPALGKHLQPSVATSPDDLGARGRRGREEGGVGLSGLLLGPSILPSTSNTGHLKSVKTLPVDAQKVVDFMPDRYPKSNFTCDVPTVEGNVWERGPEVILEKGNSVRAIFASISTSAQLLPESGKSVQISQPNCNAVNLRRPGTMGAPLGLWDAHARAVGGGGGTPDRAGTAAEQLASSRRLMQPVSGGCWCCSCSWHLVGSHGYRYL